MRTTLSKTLLALLMLSQASFCCGFKAWLIVNSTKLQSKLIVG